MLKKQLTFLLACIIGIHVFAQKQGDVLTVPGSSPAATNLPQTPSNTNNSNPSTHSVLVEFSLNLATPTGDFKAASSSNTAVGFGGSILYNPLHNVLPKKYIRPFFIGLHTDYMWFSRNSNHNTVYFNGNSFDRKYSINCGALSFGLAGRIEFLSDVIYPFVHYEAGIRIFDGVEKVTYSPNSSTNNNATQPNDQKRWLENDVTSYLGYGAGIGIKVSNNLRIEYKMSKHLGAEARYIDPSSIQLYSNNTYTYTTKRSTTDIIMHQIGISLSF